MAVDDDAVGGDLRTGAHDEPHADLELVERYLASVFERRGLHPELRELAERVAGSSAGATLEPAAEQDQRDDHCGGLEVDVGRVGAHPRCRPRRGRTSAKVDQPHAASVPIDTSVSIVAAP